ncbi:MAG TPA: caspase family protein [Bacteroidales bacterium]|nr:caspase family protein [Bacteroidales bacterium]
MKKGVIRKTLSLLMIILFLPVHLAVAQQNYLVFSAADKTNIFSDNFDDNSNQWITDNTWISGNLSNGFYDIVCKNYQGSTGLSYKPVNIEPDKDYEIEATFKVLKGIGALVFGMSDKYDHYRIEITETNTLQILKDTPSKKKKLEKLFSGSGDNQLTKEFNKLTVRCLQGVFYVFANQGLVGQFSNIKPEGNQIGFNVGTDSEISVDYLKVSYLNNKINTQVSERNSNSQPQSATVGAAVLDPANGPFIIWVRPSGENTALSSFTAIVRAKVKSSSGLKSALLYLNGVSKGEAEIKAWPDEAGSFIVEKTVNFGPGENNIYLVATNEEGARKSELRYFTNPSAVAPVITWTKPVEPNSLVGTESVPIEISITSPTDLKSVKLIINGETQTEDNIFQASDYDKSLYPWTTSAILKSGENSIYVSATNIAGTNRSEQRVIKFEAGIKDKRLALVFGNSVYRNNTTLKNPVNDANLMEGTLKELGFDVIKRLNAGKDEMEEAVREFTEKLPDYSVALFYYAGHGVQVDGRNYLIPIDALLEKPTDCKFDAMAVNFIVDEFERYPDNTNIVILDACRNNPYANWARGGDAGFRAMNFSSGTIIAFATSEGATAADGRGYNGLFTEELVKQMAVPQSILNVFMNTRVQVRKLSNNQQVPTEWNKLNGDFFFKK